MAFRRHDTARLLQDCSAVEPSTRAEPTLALIVGLSQSH